MPIVLVVDDEPEIRSSVRGILVEEGFEVVEAVDGKAALQVAKEHEPEIVLLDIWMPELDGLQALEALQAFASPPTVVMVSGHGNIETAVKATKLGAFDFIEKPLSLDALLHVVNRALDHHAAKLRSSDSEPPALASSNGTHAGTRDGNGDAGLQGARWPERTIKRSVVASGHGLHTGVKTGLILQPLPPGSGIQFANLSSDQVVPAHLDYVDSTGYATALQGNGVTVRTVEHLLATFHAYRLTNVLVKIQGEIPIMDGSAADFCGLVEDAGVEEQSGTIEEIVINRRIAIERDNGESIVIEPADEFRIDYYLRYPPPVGDQEFSFAYEGPESFRDQIAPARTFGFMRDMKQMASMGLASGGRLDNCILIDDEKVVNTTLRFPDEFARHKVLDIMGDSYLLGRPIRGAITARMTGHSDNIAILGEIRKASGLP